MDYTKHESSHGIEYTTEFGCAVFGFEKLTEQQLPQLYPQLTFFKLHQIHSDIVVPASPDSVKADAHFTTQRGTAPLIQTADCLPLIVLAKTLVLAVHAGWRGVEQNIIGQSLQHLLFQGHDFTGAQGFIGPHISAANFEVGVDVASDLESSFLSAGGVPQTTPVILPHREREKRFVDLETIARQQVASVLPDLPLQGTHLDTYSDKRFHSYRRNRTKGRQWSFGFLS